MTTPRPDAPGREQRIDWLRTHLQRDGSVTITAAAQALGASAMTIRRDLATLEALGEARRTHGGAHALGPSPFRTRSPRNVAAKIAIADKVLALVPDMGAIAIDSSSTMACLAHVLTSARDLLVVTNGLEVFDALQGRPGIRTVLTGGERDPRTSSLVGAAAETTALAFRYDVAFVSAAAVDLALGGLEVTPEEAGVVRALTTNAASVVLGADSSKIGAAASVVALRWSEVDVLVTELAPRATALAPLADSHRDGLRLL